MTRHQKTLTLTIPQSCLCSILIPMSPGPLTRGHSDEDEGSIILSLISQLRSATPEPAPALTDAVQNRDGSLPRNFSDLRPRAPQHARAHHRLHVPPRSHFWVSCACALLRPHAALDARCSAETCNDPEERFMRVLQYYLAGWHIKPKGVKKPYNPVLGEFFRCRYDYPDGSQGFYVAEQGMWTECLIVAPVLRRAWRTRSITPPAHLCVLLHLAREPPQHSRRTAAEVQVPREQRLDQHGGREPRVAPGLPARRRCVFNLPFPSLLRL